MKMIWCCVIILSVCSIEAGAITLEEARKQALVGSKELAAYELSIHNNRLSEQAESYSRYLPVLSANAAASTRLWETGLGGDSAGGGGGLGEAALYNGLTVAGSLTLRETITLYDGGTARIAEEIRAFANESVRVQALEAYFAVLAEADSAYYAVLQARASLEAAELSLENAAVGLAIAEVRLETGMISSGDYLKALIKQESEEQRFNEARRDLRLKQTRFQKLIGLAEDRDPEPVDFDAYEPVLSALAGLDDEAVDALYEALWKSVERGNPALGRSALSYQQAEKSLASAQSRYLPTLSAGFAASAGFAWTPSRESFSASGSGELSLNLSIPLDVWVTANSVARQKNQVSAANLSYEASREHTASALMSALYTAVQQAGAAVSSRRSYELSLRNHEYTMERYRLSQSSIADLSDAGLALNTAYNALNTARFAFLTSLSAIRSLGAFDDEQVIIELIRAAAADGAR
jgi:outer membrane protein